MARIHVEDSIDTDKRFIKLIEILGNETKALGLLARFWWRAQSFWLDEMNLMPLDMFEREGFGPILQSGLAEKRDRGIYAKGAMEHFSNG